MITEIDREPKNSILTRSDMANLFEVSFLQSEDGTVDKMYDLTRTLFFSGADTQTQPLTYRVASGDTWMGISFSLYGDTRYWWVLAKLNDLVDATVEPVAGSDIFVLSKGNLERVLDSIGQR